MKVCVNYISTKIRGDIEPKKKEQGETKKGTFRAQKMNSWKLKMEEIKRLNSLLESRAKNQRLKKLERKERKIRRLVQEA